MAIRLGVSGCGAHALRSHIIPGLVQGFKVAAVFDPSPENIEKLRVAVGDTFTIYKSFEEMVADPEVDAVLITSPDRFHPQQLLAAVRAGKNVLCDKPLMASFAGAAKVWAAFKLAKRHKLVVRSCHSRRVKNDPHGWVKSNLFQFERQYGPLVHVTLDFSYHEPSKAWKRNRSLLLDHFVHEIDYLRWLLGENLPFSARKLKDSFDRYTVAGEFDAGRVTFLCVGTRKLKGEVYAETIQLRFKHGEVMVDVTTGQVDRMDHEDRFIDYDQAPPLNYDHRFERLASQFRVALRQGQKSHILHTMWINNLSALMLAKIGWYRCRPKPREKGLSLVRKKVATTLRRLMSR